MGNTETFCNCENNDSKFEQSFRTGPNQNNQSSDRILCPFVHTVIYQNYTLENNNSKNKRTKNKKNKGINIFDNNNYEMNFECRSEKKLGNDTNTLKNHNKGIFNLNPIIDNYSQEKRSNNNSFQDNNKYNDKNDNNEIIDNNSINEEKENDNDKENSEVKNINTKVDNIDLNMKIKNNSSDNSENSEAPTTNLDKPNKTQKNGVDIQYLGKNTYYIGYIQYGIREGFGKMVTGDNIYTGEFSNDQANGYGIYKKNGGELIYEGYWLNDEQNDYGIEKWNDESIFYGEYSKQIKNGIGIYVWKDGSRYEGEFKDNMFDGYGIYFFKKNRIYLGEWKNNKKHGYGEYIIDDKLYIGEYNMDLRDGFGINYFKSEDKLYIGFWKNNKRCGFGKIYNQKKMRYGLWFEQNDENKKTKFFGNEQEAMDYLKQNGLYDKYKKFFECSKDELIKSYDEYFKEDFIQPNILSIENSE